MSPHAGTGLPAYRPTGLPAYRRTGATVLARGIGVDVASTFLRHTSTAINQKHYIKLDTLVDQTPASILDRTLRPVDPDGTLLGQRVSDEEEDLLDKLDKLDGDDLEGWSAHCPARSLCASTRASR